MTASVNVSGVATAVGDVQVRRMKQVGLGYEYRLDVAGLTVLLTGPAFDGLAADVIAEMSLDDYQSRDSALPPLDVEPRVEDLEGCHE